MKPLLLLFLLASCLALTACASSFGAPNGEAYLRFLDFEQTYSKSYSSPSERSQRFAIFANNLGRVDQLNRLNALQGGADDVFGVTKFMDLSPEEFAGFYLNAKPSKRLAVDPEQILEIAPKSPADLPESKDWRNTTGVITPVKNQEQCGSCWAFSATEAIESAWVLAGKPQVILAPQQIVDCDQMDGGCNGGDTPTAYEYVIKAGGQETEKDYPYVGENGKCKFDKSQVAASIRSWKYVAQSAAQELTTMLTYVGTEGPVSVCVDAAPWQYYQGGILKTCGRTVDHCVQVTGYATESGTDVWIVRNSWGKDWGLDGYIWVERGKDLCSIAGEVTVAVV